MRRAGWVALVLCFLGWLGPELGWASTQCVGRFEFLGLTDSRTRPVFWIAHDVSGECSYTGLMQVIIEPSGYDVIATEFQWDYDEDYDENWAPLKEAVRRFETEAPDQVGRQDGTWFLGKRRLRVQAPPREERWTELFDKHVTEENGSNGVTWNEKHGREGILLPTIEGAQAELVVYYPAGFYANYDIASIYYFSRAGYILVFTHQSLHAVGLDSMHGFLILRVPPEPEPEPDWLAKFVPKAVRTLHTLNTALKQHAATYPQCGFPDSLADLRPGPAPGPEQSGLLEPGLAQDTFEQGRYTFSYRLTAGKGDCQAEPGAHYSLDVRPLVYLKTGVLSFFTDHTGVVRYTSENRAATVDDPPQPPPPAE